MRLLKFNVDSQRISKDPDCDFSGLVAGTQNYLKASFTFSPDWHDCTIVASFWKDGKEYAVCVEDGTCDIPREVLTESVFRVSVIGQRGHNPSAYRIVTNKILVRQEVYM